IQYMRPALHHILYTTAHSWLYDEATQGGIEGWKLGFYAADALIAAIVVGGLVAAFKKRNAAA
ncbi:MAG: hypothetical protein IJH87_05480, partial [Atopobiaceae bacterium]|nr:hypothetical protein [Atopobiaceae bacterium]